MSQSPRHGGPGCPCEECLTARITQSAAHAADGRDMSGLRMRLDRLRVRVEAPAEVLVNAS